MDKTVASERDDVGLRVAPSSERRRPLARATQIEHRLTRSDHLAEAIPASSVKHRPTLCPAAAVRAMGYSVHSHAAAAAARRYRRCTYRAVLYRLTVYAGTELGAETSDDPPRAPGYLRRVGTQGVRDRVVRLTVEQHREHREVVVVELRDRCLEYVARDRWHHDFSVGDPCGAR